MVVLAVFLALGLGKPLEWTMSRNAPRDGLHRRVSARAPRKQQRVRMITNRALPGTMARAGTYGPRPNPVVPQAMRLSLPGDPLSQGRIARLAARLSLFQPLRC